MTDESQRGDVFTQYICKCSEGYTGVHCETGEHLGVCACSGGGHTAPSHHHPGSWAVSGSIPASGPPGEREAGPGLSEALDWPGFRGCSPGFLLPGPLSWGCRPGFMSLRVVVAPADPRVPLPGSP